MRLLPLFLIAAACAALPAPASEEHHEDPQAEEGSGVHPAEPVPKRAAAHPKAAAPAGHAAADSETAPAGTHPAAVKAHETPAKSPATDSVAAKPKPAPHLAPASKPVAAPKAKAADTGKPGKSEPHPAGSHPAAPSVEKADAHEGAAQASPDSQSTNKSAAKLVAPKSNAVAGHAAPAAHPVAEPHPPQAAAHESPESKAPKDHAAPDSEAPANAHPAAVKAHEPAPAAKSQAPDTAAVKPKPAPHAAPAAKPAPTPTPKAKASDTGKSEKADPHAMAHPATEAHAPHAETHESLPAHAAPAHAEPGHGEDAHRADPVKPASPAKKAEDKAAGNAKSSHPATPQAEPAHGEPAKAPAPMAGKKEADPGAVQAKPEHAEVHGEPAHAEAEHGAKPAHGAPEKAGAHGESAHAPEKPEHGEAPAAKEIHAAPAQAGHGEPEHEAAAGGHEPAAHESGKHKEPAERAHGDGDEENTPSMAPKPDTAFARAADWEKGQAEVLTYSVTRRGKTGPIQCKGSVVTERMYLRKDGTADRKPAGKGDVEVLNTVLSAAGEDGGQPFALQTVVKLPRREHLKLLRQDQSLQSWPGATHRFLDCAVTPPRLRVVSSGGETVRDTLIERWPIYTEEMLFTYLRSVPQRAGYREEVWLQDWGEEGRFSIKPQFAAISVRSKTMGIRDMETWYITVDREDGRRSEFWVSTAGLHPVVLAVLADRSAWTLQEISRKKYWSW
jgi:hypothetical protein